MFIGVPSQHGASASAERRPEFRQNPTTMFGTCGFFDLNGVPPWDLWVGLFKFSLATWIPDSLIEVAELGMASADRYVFWDTWRDFLLHQDDNELPGANA